MPSIYQNTGKQKRLVRLQAWLMIIPAYSIMSSFHTDTSSRVKAEKVIHFVRLDTIFAYPYRVTGDPFLRSCQFASITST